MNDIKISIIIPVYNAEKYLEQCLDSVLAQTLTSFEVICINDGSTDSSLEILKHYQERDSRFTIFDIPNGGVSNARNKGLEYAKGEFVTFLDSDDWLDVNFCEKLYNTAKDENADIVMCSYCKEYQGQTIIAHALEKERIVFDRELIERNIHRRFYGLIDDELKYPEKGDSIVSPWMQLFKVDLAKKAKFVDIREVGTFEDGLYQIDVYQYCNCFAYIDDPLYHYRKTNNQSITTKYKSDLFIRWQHLYDLMEDRIVENGYGDDYKQALSNRICFGLIGLGLNELADKQSNGFVKSKRLKQFLETERYQTAFQRLRTEVMPLKWKVFFGLCKKKYTLLLVFLLRCMNWLRSKK